MSDPKQEQTFVWFEFLNGTYYWNILNLDFYNGNYYHNAGAFLHPAKISEYIGTIAGKRYCENFIQEKMNKYFNKSWFLLF